jgi:hypothetical protein
VADYLVRCIIRVVRARPSMATSELQWLKEQTLLKADLAKADARYVKEKSYLDARVRSAEWKAEMAVQGYGHKNEATGVISIGPK